MKAKDSLIVVLLGVVATLLLVLVFQVQSSPKAQGQAAASSGVGAGRFIMATSTSGTTPVCFIYDCDKQRLATYTVGGSGGLLRLGAVRTCKLDFKVLEYGRSVPAYRKMESEIKKRGGGGGR